MTAGVYKITCLANGRMYIGASGAVCNRLSNHKCHLRKSYRSCNRSMLSDFQRYGEGAFRFEILMYCDSRDDAMSNERQIIAEHYGSGILYNVVNESVRKATRRGDKPTPVQIRVTPQDYDAMRKAAEQHRMPLATFVRWVIMREVSNGN